MRGLIVGTALSLAVLTAPDRAEAHAAILSSEPEAGAQLSSAPGVVVLRFTEPLNVRLSRATVVDPAGTRFETTSTGDREIRVRVTSNVIGVYAVEWITVSTVDGHTLHGVFRFGVGVSPGAGAEGETSLAPSGTDLVVAVARAVEFLGLLVALGMLLLARLARRDPPLAWVRARVPIALALALAGGIAVVVGEALLAAPSASPGEIWNFLTTGMAGLARLIRPLAEGVALLAAVRGASALPALSVSIVAVSAAGHAAAVRPAWWGISVDVVHLASAGLWAGGILALATMRPPGGWRGGSGRALLERFTPVALPAFVITVAAGVLRGVQELGGLGPLFGSSYGIVLVVKTAAVVAMVPLSVLAWRRVLGSPRLEAAVAVVVVAAAALLAAYPLPPGRLDEAEAARVPPARNPALPRAGDLTLGGEAGEVLVGLTVRPGEPGTNEVLAYVLPIEGEDAAAPLRTTLVANGRSLPMETCAVTCRRATIDLAGGEDVAIQVEGRGGSTARFSLPSLPAPDGAALLRRMQARMHELRTYRIRETLGPVDPPIVATYAFRAPDRMRVELSSGSASILVGDRRYRRDAPGEPWRESMAPPLDVPTFIWDARGEFVAPRILDRQRVGGRPTTVVSFFTGGNVPIWFRLWIDTDGLVRRAEMRAQGHFMDHRYFDFDAPLSIPEPTVPGG